ncbi:unnamed protein product, partial [Owenia fusiformis]
MFKSFYFQKRRSFENTIITLQETEGSQTLDITMYSKREDAVPEGVLTISSLENKGGLKSTPGTTISVSLFFFHTSEYVLYSLFIIVSTVLLEEAFLLRTEKEKKLQQEKEKDKKSNDAKVARRLRNEALQRMRKPFQTEQNETDGKD